MQPGDLEARMRLHETAGDCSVPADMYMVARLVGRGFSRLRARLDLEGPVEGPDLRARDVLIATADHLMHCLEVTYGYTHGDELSLLLRRDERAFDRDPRRLIAVLAGEASAKHSLLLGELACFDCRILELPDAAVVVDYFCWRQAEATREALATQCAWALRRAGASPDVARARLHGLGLAELHALLPGLDIDIGALPDWYRYGAGLHWARHEQGSQVPALRRRLRVELELPHGDAYAAFMRDQVERASTPEP